MKKIISILLSLVIMASLVSGVMAEEKHMTLFT